MQLNYNAFKMVENDVIYLCQPLGKIISSVKGIDVSTFKREKHINNISEMSFDVSKYIEENGNIIENPMYDKLLKGMELFIDKVGYFVINSTNESFEDHDVKKSIEATSIDSELQKSSLTILINYETEDSLECQVEDENENLVNIDPITGRPLQLIKLYNKNNPKLSLLNLSLEKSKCNWTIGYVSPIISELELKIQIENQDLYSFFTQDIAKASQCIFDFDCVNRVINVYSIDEIGYDTGIYISFRNLLKTISITSNTEQFYTRYNVKGKDINIDDVNFGNSWIEDLTYLMNVRDSNDNLIFVSEDLRERYYGWKNYIETDLRPYYIEKNSELLKLKNELYLLEYRTPNDFCSEDWAQYTDDDLTIIKNSFKEKYENIQLKYREKYHKELIIDSEIKETEYWFDYFCFRSIINSINNEELYRSSLVNVWSGKKGDVNGDGNIDNIDAELVAKFLKGQTKLKDSQIERADWNQDGFVDNNDLKNIKDFINISTKENRYSTDYQTEWSLYGYEELKKFKEDYLAKLEDLNNLGVICYTEESDETIKAINKIDAHDLSYNDLAIFLDPNDGFAPNGEVFTLGTPTASVKASSHGYMVFENIQNGIFELWKNASPTSNYYDIEYKILDFNVDDVNKTSSIILSENAISNGCYIEEYINPITSIHSKYVHIKLNAKKISNVVGDTNGDGLVDTYDLILAEEMMNGETDFDMSYDSSTNKYGSYQLKRADINGDGCITQDDLNSIEKLVNINLNNGVLVKNNETAKRYILYINEINRYMKVLENKINNLNDNIKPLEKHVNRIIKYAQKDFKNDYESCNSDSFDKDFIEPPNSYYFSNSYGVNRYFTNTDLKILNQLNYDTEYINESLNIDNDNSIIELENNIMMDAIHNLSIVSQPQLSFSASLNNLLAIEDFKCMHSDFDVGNFIRLEYDNGYYVKLRVIKITYNSLEIQNDSLEIEFSNTLHTNISCNNFTSIIDKAIQSNNTFHGDNQSPSNNLKILRDMVNKMIDDKIDDFDIFDLIGNQYANKNSILKHLLDGSTNGSLRSINSKEEDENYKLGENSIAIGDGSTARGSNSISVGIDTEANGSYSVAMGIRAIADGYSTAIGDTVKAQGDGAFASGEYTGAYSSGAHSEGVWTLADEYCSHAEGYSTRALGYSSHAEGYNTMALAYAAHAEGELTKAYGQCSHAEGNNTIALDYASHAEGEQTAANHLRCHAEGHRTAANGECSHAEGYGTMTLGYNSHAEGELTKAILESSHAEGDCTICGNILSISGNITCTSTFKTTSTYNISIGDYITFYTNKLQYNHDDSRICTAKILSIENNTITIENNGLYLLTNYVSYAKINDVQIKVLSPITYYIHIDFSSIIPKEYDRLLLCTSHNRVIYSDKIQNDIEVDENNLIPFICNNITDIYVYNDEGYAAHAEGGHTKASGRYSHAGGYGTNAKEEAQTVIGQYNADNSDALFIIGNGTSEDNRSNALEVLKDGTLVINEYYVKNSTISNSYIINLEIADKTETNSRIGYNISILLKYRKGIDNLSVNINDDIYIPLTISEGDTYIFSYYDVDKAVFKNYKLEVDFVNNTYIKTYIETSNNLGGFNIENLTVEENGLYTPPENTYYNNVNVNVKNSGGENETMSLYGQNYDINAVDLTIPGSVEYVKDQLYDMTTLYTNTYTTGYKADLYENASRHYSYGVEVIKPCLQHLTLSEGVKQVGDKAFYGQTNLDRIDFPESLEWVHGWAFEKTAWLNEQPLGAVFCNKVLYLYKGQFPLNNTSLNYALVKDKNFIVPKNTVSISTYAFRNARGFQNISFYNEPQDYSLIGIGDYSFYNCKFSDSVSTVFGELPNSITWIGKGAFMNSKAKISSIPPVNKIQQLSFSDCDFSDIDLVIPDSVKIIEDSAFYNSNIKTLDLGNGVRTIGKSAFEGISNSMQTLTIPKNVQSISNKAFANNTFWTINLPNTLVHMENDSFENCKCTNLVVEEGFCVDYLNISSFDLFQDRLEKIIDNLADRTGLMPGYITFGTTNMNKISATKKALAASKNWTLA